MLTCALVALAGSPVGSEGLALPQARARPVAATSTPTPPPTPQAPQAPEPPSTPPRARTATVVMGGDLLWHDTVWLSAQEDHARTGRGKRFDFAPMFAALAPLVREADLAICHEEVPFAAPGQPFQSYPVFAAPPAIAPWIADTGFDACVTASNHTVDQGWDGLVRTADLLEDNGVRHVGTSRSPAERRRPVVMTTDQGVRIGIVAGTYGLNGFPLPEGRPWSVSMGDADNLLRQAARARRAGADVVVVHLHGGNEYDHLPNADQVALVEQLTASPDVDLVLGEHAHVVQPITKVNGTWVVYGMGNMVAQQEVERPRTYEGITVRFTFTEQPDGGFEVSRAAYVPTYWNHWSPGRPIRIQRVVSALAAGRGDLARLREARREIREAVRGLGRTPGLLER
ncbi:hypothetical protein NSZ01_34070 [Nocardioides szechwanensis]|nr:hypothetical protein NSZ01_34070 [Nocardioides szechwanensis]